MNEEKLLVMDRTAIKYAPMSYMITKEEYRKVHPEMDHGRRIAFILKFGKPEILPLVEALFLISKYENLYLVDDNHKEITVEEAKKPFKRKDDEKDDLTDMDYIQLRDYADAAYGINAKTFDSMKWVDIKKEVRRLRRLGAQPKKETEISKETVNETI